MDPLIPTAIELTKKWRRRQGHTAGAPASCHRGRLGDHLNETAQSINPPISSEAPKPYPPLLVKW